jgi:N-acetylglucosamine-6-phosphate deacetylase
MAASAPGNNRKYQQHPTPSKELIMSDYFDLQVNGCYGVDFNQDVLTAEDMHRACQGLEKDGVSGILATVITADLERMIGRLRRIVELREQDPLVKKMVVGLHIEGPFLNPTDGYRGAHPLDAVRPATIDAAKRLLDAGNGLTRIITLAPECDQNMAVTQMLDDYGVVVSAGHCDPSLDHLKEAIDAGLSMFTHVGNACPMQMHRHDNIIQRALSQSDRLWLCFIGDGVHLPFMTLSNYLRTAGLERAIVVSDAIAPAGLGPGRYTNSQWDVEVGEDLVAWAPDRSHLLGSAISMTRTAANLIDYVGLTATQARQLTCENPRRAIPNACGYSNPGGRTGH